MRLVLLGVRGSTPAPGAEFVRYGGHTSCVVVLADGETAPSLVLDGGTGLRGLPALTGSRPFRGTLVLTHLHWDHVQGIPFCPVIDHRDAQVDLLVPGTWDDPAGSPTPRALLARAMSPPHFPIRPEGLLGSWRFRPALTGRARTAVAGLWLEPAPHKGGPMLAVRVDLDGASVAYLPDHLPREGAPTQEALARLLDGVDLLLHDAQFLDEEHLRAADYGHSTIGQALRLADRHRVGRVLLTHHAPGRTDDELDRLAARVTSTPEGRPVAFARQGDDIDVSRDLGRPLTRLVT
jgi:ribonuclease BN (tRNA processing enzyme)